MKIVDSKKQHLHVLVIHIETTVCTDIIAEMSLSLVEYGYAYGL